MPPLSASISLLSLLVACSSSSLTNMQRDVLRYRAWDLRFYSEATPTCNPDDPNSNLTLYHPTGANVRTCENDSYLNDGVVKSISWKSPEESNWFDFCMWSTADCSGGQASFLGSITNGWDVCYPYNGFLGWTVVRHGDACA